MCNPAVVSLVISAVTTATQAYAQSEQIKTDNEANEYNARIAEQNRDEANREAGIIEKEGQKELSDFRKRLAGFKSKQRSSFAGSGVIVGEGTPIDILRETQQAGDIDALSMRKNTQRQVYSKEFEAFGFEQEAGLLRARKGNASRYLTTSLLTGMSALAQQYSSTYSAAPKAKGKIKIGKIKEVA